ncbi:hypothetical protein Q7C36_010548 [Tachysurus vachellii]|uniref:Uncharacterized protein n=1 Tax=Tachysurus vachellii TaxID=175792 RepID=A0AA88MZ98_TACVA|nr:hypothetical protein Q7C36_010548 [Tachysurus vachellii]
MAESQQRGPLRETARYNTHEAGTLWLGAFASLSSPNRWLLCVSQRLIEQCRRFNELCTGAFPCFLEVEGSVEIYDMADCPSLSSTAADQQKGKEKLRRSKSQTLSCCTWC